jgi:hypothetical protein
MSHNTRHLIDGLRVFVMTTRAKYGFLDTPSALRDVVARLADTRAVRRLDEGDGEGGGIESMAGGGMASLVALVRSAAPHLFVDGPDGEAAPAAPDPKPRTPPTAAQARGLSARDKLALANGEDVAPKATRAGRAETALDLLRRANEGTTAPVRYAELPPARPMPTPTTAKRETASQKLARVNGDAVKVD